jgi:hypothetical protein
MVPFLGAPDEAGSPSGGVTACALPISETGPGRGDESMDAFQIRRLTPADCALLRELNVVFAAAFAAAESAIGLRRRATPIAGRCWARIT